MTLPIQPLNPYNKFVDEGGKLTRDGYSFLYNLFLRVGGSLSNLNAATLLDKTWSEPAVIGDVTPSSAVFTALLANTSANLKNLTVTTGINNNASGLKHARVSTGAIGAISSALVTCTWPSTFANANYTVVASVEDSTAALLSLRVVHLESKTASAVVVRVENTSGGSLTGTLHLIAMHD